MLLCLCLSAASLPWRKDPKQWSREDVERVLEHSPWAQAAPATFPDNRSAPPQSVYDLPGPAQAGMPAPKNAATDGRWDGGVSRNNGAGMLPSLSVLVRWESALPIRQALLRSKALGMLPTPGTDPTQAAAEPASYILTITGLVPSNQYRSIGALPKQSSSDADDGTRPAKDTEQVLEGLMGNTRLLVRGKATLRPENVKLDPATGVIRVFFPRTVEIVKSDKEVLFTSRFGSLTLEKRFHLNDMMYQNRLEL